MQRTKGIVELGVLVRLDGNDGRGCQLGVGEHTLGSGSESVLALPAPAAEAHARLLVRPFAALIADLRTPAGTYLNGVRLEVPTVLTDGDRLRIGASEWRVRVDPSLEPAAGPAELPARLEIVEGERVLTALPIDDGQVRVVGRAPEADLTLPDRFTSRRHALLRRDGNQLYVQDAGSINGVVVGGQRVREARLADGESVTIGRTTVRFRLARPAPPLESERPVVGQVGPYRLYGELGRGGMGLVFEAQRPGREVVALKVVRTDGATDAMAAVRCRRFEREAQVLRRIRHENVVGLIEAGQHDGRPYLALELLEGEALVDVLRRRQQLPTNEIERIVFQLCAALRAVHEAGVIHRDIKPANVILSGPRRTVKLMDFGIARLRDDLDLSGDAEELAERAVEPSVTAEGRHPGTPLFMSPEQIRGREIDMRSDIWSLGVVLYLLSAGRAPFSAVGQEAVKQAVLSACPAPLPDSAPAYLRSAIYRCLLKNPKHRFASATELMEALHERRIEQPVPVGVDGPIAPPPNYCPSCGSYVSAKQLDCPTCRLDLRPYRAGYLVAAEMDGQFIVACGRCGLRTDIGARECQRCGHLFLAPRSEVDAAPSAATSPDQTERLADQLAKLGACPCCGSAVEPSRPTCAGCGLQLGAVIHGRILIQPDEHGLRWPYCTHCGTRLRLVRAETCAKCGTHFATGQRPEPPDPKARRR